MKIAARLSWLGFLIAAPLFQTQGLAADQNVITLAGGGYTVSQPSLNVAPGQLIVLHVYGVPTLPDNRVNPIPGDTGYPQSIDGVSVDLIQGNPLVSTRLGLHALYQSNCAQPDACSPLTGITLQIPFEVDVDFAAKGNPFPVLRISQNGKPLGGVMLQPVTDNVHVLNTCDDTQVYVSAAYSIPQNICAPVVMVNGALNSLYNLAHGGDIASVWLYGMGAKTQQSPDCCNSPDQLSRPVQQFQLNYDFRPNVPASPAVPGFGTTSAPLAAAYTGGTYQLNFVVPPPPAGTPPCDGVKIKSNLTVTITGPNSFDAAQICVKL